MEGDWRGEAQYGIPKVIRWSVWIWGIPWSSLPWEGEDEGVEWRWPCVWAAVMFFWWCICRSRWGWYGECDDSTLEVRPRGPLRILAGVLLGVSFPLLEGFDLDLFGPLTRPSLAYSQIRPRVKQRLHAGCSPLHYEMRMWLTWKDRRLEKCTDLCLPCAAFLACLCGAQSRVLWCTVEDASWRIEWACKR